MARVSLTGMNLEDHLGDIIRKARTMSNVSASDTARTAGLTEAELAALEESGHVTRKPDFEALSQFVGLQPFKVEAIANGWLPKEPDLGAWRELRWISTTGNGMAVSCYLVWDDVSREAAVFDTGWDAQPIFALIAENQLQLRHLFITHSHPDHIAAVGAICEKFPKVRVHSNMKDARVDQRNRANDFVHLGSLRITNRDTPGHAPDGVTYIIGNWPEDAPHVAIVGDAIFAGSMGGGNEHWDLARQKVREQILTLPPETLICPGHGPLTTVGQEKTHNPFF
jgi:hydroxyacylglutathione hydrolase